MTNWRKKCQLTCSHKILENYSLWVLTTKIHFFLSRHRNNIRYRQKQTSYWHGFWNISHCYSSVSEIEFVSKYCVGWYRGAVVASEEEECRVNHTWSHAGMWQKWYGKRVQPHHRIVYIQCCKRNAEQSIRDSQEEEKSSNPDRKSLHSHLGWALKGGHFQWLTMVEEVEFQAEERPRPSAQQMESWECCRVFIRVASAVGLECREEEGLWGHPVGNLSSIRSLYFGK